MRPARIRLGQSPLEIAPLGAGCWAWGDTRYWRYGEGYGPAEVIGAYTAYRQAGVDFFDTAEAYGWGKGEKLLGALVRRAGNRVVLATKYAPLAGRGGAAAIGRAIAGSLKRLGVAQIDLYQLHWADSDEVPIAAAMDAFADAIEAGHVRAAGVSNLRAGEMRQAHAALARRGIPLATNQVRYSLLHRAPEADGVLDACRELGVTLLAYSPLEQGLLAGKYDTGTRPADSRAEAAWFSPAHLAAAQPLLRLLRALAAEHGVEPAAVALAWLLAQPGVIPIAGAKNAAQAMANAQALQLELPPDALAALGGKDEG